MRFSWTQYHNPDRYSGTEYVTGNDVRIESLDGSAGATYPNSLTGVPRVRFTPQWPGNYRFELIAGDKDGESRQSIDVLVRWTQQLDIRGVDIYWWFGEWSDRSIDGVFDRLTGDGVNWVQFNPEWCQDSLTSSDLHPCVPCRLRPMSTAELRQAIQKAHARGWGVLLKPHISVASGSGIFIQPSDWDEWFDSYTNYLVQMATLASEEGVEMFSVGNELATTHAHVDKWESLVQEVRSVFSGYLTYSDLCMQRPGLCTGEFPVWDQMDFIGVSFYFDGTCHPIWGCGPGVTAPASSDPSVELMAEQMDRQLSLSVDLIQSKYDLPVIATEIGIKNADGANYDPANSPSLIMDNREQADWYEAAFRTMSARSWWRGCFWHKIDPIPEPFPYDSDVPWKTFDPRFKPAEEVLAVWFGAR